METEIKSINGKTLCDSTARAGLGNKSETTHTHDERYYTETEVNALLAAKAATSHTHAQGDVTGLSSALAAKAVKATYTASITTTWTGTSAPYTQAVTVSGILATDNPHITPVYSTTNATAILEKTAWNCISKAVTSANTITFTCFEEMPETVLSLQIEVVR